MLNVEFNKLSVEEEVQFYFKTGTPFYFCPEFHADMSYKGQLFILLEDLPLYGKVVSIENADKGFVVLEIEKNKQKTYIEVSDFIIQINTKWWEL